MKHIFLIILFIHLLSFVTNAQTPDEYGSFSINYPWSSEFQFRIYDKNGKMIRPEHLKDGSFEMHSVLPKTKGEHALQFDISSDYFIYSHESDTEIYLGWVFIMGNDTMSISIPNYPTNMSIDSIPFTKGQFFVSENEFNSVNLQNRIFDYKKEHDFDFSINGSIIKNLDFSTIDSFRFEQNNYNQKDYPNDADMYEYDGYYKSTSFKVLSGLKGKVHNKTKQVCEIVELPIPIPFDFIATNNFLEFNARSAFIIDNEKDLKEALGKSKLNIDIDFSKEIILQKTVGGDCFMWLRHQVIKDVNKKIITWRIYNFWGRCRAGGMKSTWIKIAKPEEGFEAEVDVVLVD